VASFTLRPLYLPERTLVQFKYETGWAQAVLVGCCEVNISKAEGIRTPDHPVASYSPYRMYYPGFYQKRRKCYLHDPSSYVTLRSNYTSQQDFVPRKVYCVSNVTFHAESKHAINFFSITHSFCTMGFFVIDFSKF
jgi:hypothetical protein